MKSGYIKTPFFSEKNHSEKKSQRETRGFKGRWTLSAAGYESVCILKQTCFFVFSTGKKTSST